MTEAKLSPAVRAFLDERRFASLATINADGSPQQTVMWYMLRDDHVMMNTRAAGSKIATWSATPACRFVSRTATGT